MSSAITMKTVGTVARAQAFQTKNAASSQALPIFPQYSSPIDLMLMIPSFVVSSVEQAVSPAFAAQSYRMWSTEVEVGRREAYELGPRSEKTSPILPQHNSSVDLTLATPPFVVSEQAVSPAFAAQSYRMWSTEVEIGRREAYELGPRSGKL